MSVIDTLITDRTEGAYYNASDLNRVGTAVLYLQSRLASVGMTSSGTVRTDWTAADIPTQGEMEDYLAAVAAIREKIREYRPGAELPESIRHLDYNGANRIESLLSAAEEVVRNVQLSYRGYSGRLTTGVNCLP